MNKIKSTLIAALFFAVTSMSNAQTLNWQNINSEQHQIVNLNIGWDYGFVFGLGYGYYFNTKFPIVLKSEFSFPSGGDFLDDFKFKTGARIKWFQYGDFCFSTDTDVIFRRFENSYVRLLNIGSYASTTIGYYRPNWFVAGEFGFDKAIVTHFKHSDEIRNSFPKIRDGWYKPATGGNFNYGLLSGFSFSEYDIYLKAGKVIEEDFKTNPLIPFYLQLGFNWRMLQPSE